MKKGFVALLIVLAVIVLISPGIVGRLAEKSMDENLDWAATESQEVVITSQGFDRGWFSSAGQHRVEVRDGELREALLGFAGSDDVGELPVLVIDTQLDHGLVPVTSMSRDQGSLMPGLGRAVSKLSLEFGDGESIELPGTIYSDVGLTGLLSSNYIVESGSFSDENSTARWGDSDILVKTNPSNGNVDFSGVIESLSMDSYGSNVSVDKIEFSGNQQPTKFGFSVGEVAMKIASATVPANMQPVSIGPFVIKTEAELDGDRVSGRTRMELNNLLLADLGTAAIFIDATIVDMDGEAIGNITRVLEKIDSYGNADEAMLYMQADLQRLLSAGFEFRVEQLDVELPQGRLQTKIDISMDKSDGDDFSWPAALLALDATLDLKVPAVLMDLATAMDPQFNAAVGMGFLRKKGDVYEMQAAFQNGLLTVNGAPMPLPIPGLN